MRNLGNVSSNGTTLKDIIDVATKLKMESRVVRVELPELEKLNNPCIIHWNMNHFVVLKHLNKKKAILHDPAIGKIEVDINTFDTKFTGIALILEPDFNFEKKDERESLSAWQIFNNSIGLGKTLTTIFAFSVILELLGIILPIINQIIIDTIINTDNLSTLNSIIISFLFLIFIKALVSLIRTQSSINLRSNFIFQWRKNILDHMLKLPYYWFEQRHIGDINSKFSSIKKITDVLTDQFLVMILDLIVSIGLIIILLIYSLTIGFLILLTLVFFIGYRFFFIFTLAKHTKNKLIFEANAESFFIERIKGIISVKTFNIEEKESLKWSNYEIDSINTDIKIRKITMYSEVFNTILFGLQSAMILWIGANYVIDGYLTVGMIVAIITYKDIFSVRSARLVDYLISFKLVKLELSRLSDIILSKKEISMEEDNLFLSKINRTEKLILELKNISFRYADNLPWIFQNLSLSIECGDNVAIIGPSGCGKSTLLKIMIGLIQPNNGEILLNGYSIEKIGLSNYRRIIGTVMQEDFLFSGSIAENISLSDNKINMEKVISSAKLANIEEDIRNMIMGYNTIITDIGNSLSGGQKQRIILARALYKNPKIIFLDEATSSLDSINEEKINFAISSLPVPKIIISHKESTLKLCNKIYNLELKKFQ